VKQLFLTLIITGLLFPVFSQKAPIKFGKVEKKELLMDVYEPDTSAPAVVLCEYGFFDGNDLDFTHLIRVKILKNNGLQYADWKFVTGNKAMIKGKTFNLVNGDIEVEKLSNSDIHRTRFHDAYYVQSIAMPAVKVGSVIDIQVTYPLIPSEWYFQRDIPVAHSELILTSNQYIAFRKNFFGLEYLTSSTDDRYIAKNMPAFKDEPYMSSAENYITKFEFDILDIKIENYYKAYTKSWEHLSEFLEKHDYFGLALNSNYNILQKIKEIEDNSSSEKEKIIAAYREVQKMHFNDWHYLFTTERSLGPVFDNKEGNSADINLLLYLMLDRMELNPDIVVLSTRSNGMLSPVFPSLERLNHCIVKIDIDGETFLLDATDPFTPYYLLPEKDLNAQGRLINPKGSGWVDLFPQKKHTTKKLLRLELSEDGVLKGTKSCVYEDYSAIKFRSKFAGFENRDAFIQSLLKSNPGLSISDLKIENLSENELPVKLNCELEITEKTMDLGSEMYLFPFLCEQITENPFETPYRKTPVDFIYQIEDGMTVSIQIPEGWEVTEAPQPVNMSLPGNAASVLCQVAAFGNTINMTYRFMMNQTLFTKDQYPDLKAFYEQVLKIQEQPILLKKAE